MLKLTGIIGGIELPFDGCNVDACSDLSTGACPVAPGDEIVYELQIPVRGAATKLNLYCISAKGTGVKPPPLLLSLAEKLRLPFLMAPLSSCL